MPAGGLSCRVPVLFQQMCGADVCRFCPGWRVTLTGMFSVPAGEGCCRALVLFRRNGSGFLPTTQVFRTEMYTYDANGNRATKTTAYGTITYSYDEENRLLKTCGVSGDGVE